MSPRLGRTGDREPARAEGRSGPPGGGGQCLEGRALGPRACGQQVQEVIASVAMLARGIVFLARSGAVGPALPVVVVTVARPEHVGGVGVRVLARHALQDALDAMRDGQMHGRPDRVHAEGQRQEDQGPGAGPRLR